LGRVLVFHGASRLTVLPKYGACQWRASTPQMVNQIYRYGQPSMFGMPVPNGETA
jgi:hypothetical protein